MPVTVTLTTTPESARDTFVSVADADAVIAKLAVPGADEWRALTGDSGTDTKARYLYTATADVSAGAVWSGGKRDAEQALEWPRYRLYPEEDKDGDDGIPAEVKLATCYQALFRLSGRTKDVEAQLDGVMSASVGGPFVSFRGATTILCREALFVLRSWRLAGACIA